MRRVALIVLLTVLTTLLGFRVSRADDAASAVNGPTIVLLSLTNYTTSPDAIGLFEPILRAQLGTLGMRVPEGDAVRQVLREHRIRAVGEVPTTGAAALHAELGADYALTGSYDVFIPDGVAPEAALSLRLIDLSTLTVVWARSVGATGRDFESVFGLGQIVATDDLAARLVATATDGLRKVLDPSTGATAPRGERVAVIQFDDIVLDAPGSGIVTAQTITQLVRRGYTVVEPGVVRELFFDFQRFPRGGIDYELLAALHDSLGVALVVTGAVDQFHTGVPSVEQSYPSIAINGRVIDTETGRIMWIAQVSGDGDHELVLGMGSTRAAAGVTGSTTSHMLNELHLKEGARDNHR